MDGRLVTRCVAWCGNIDDFVHRAEVHGSPIIVQAREFFRASLHDRHDGEVLFRDFDSDQAGTLSHSVADRRLV